MMQDDNQVIGSNVDNSDENPSVDSNNQQHGHQQDDNSDSNVNTDANTSDGQSNDKLGLADGLSVTVDEIGAEIVEGGSLTQETYDELVKVYGVEATDRLEQELIDATKGMNQDDSDDSDGDYDDGLQLSESQLSKLNTLSEPYGGIEAMGEKAQLLLVKGLATEEQLMHIGKMMVSDGAVGKQAINEFSKLVSKLDVQSSFTSSSAVVTGGYDDGYLISANDYGKQVREAVRKGDTNTINALDKRVAYTIKHKPDYWN